MKNRIIALLLVMVVAVLSFASCGIFGGDEEDPSKTVVDPDNTTVNYPWEKTKLKFEMTLNSDSSQLPSSCPRYLAGDLETSGDLGDYSTVDQYVSERNSDAYEATKVEVEYVYVFDTSEYGWGNNINRIVEEVEADDPANPDMYCNFVYDMVAISLQKGFANLYSTTMYEDGHELAGLNYFEFAEDREGYVDTGVGYMYEYMRSLTLSKSKMYCLSSDYFVDMVRAFFVVPVNIALLNTIDANGAEGTYNYDRVTTVDENGNAELYYTIDDLYQLVNDMDWTYDTLADFANAVTEQGGEGDYTTDLNDTVGFALGSSSGLPSSGMLYTTSITIIDRKLNVSTGEYTYSYPYMQAVTNDKGEVTSYEKTSEGTHEELIQFCANLKTLFESHGVISVSDAAASSLGYASSTEAIRQRFASGNVLFGGVIVLGALEYDEYKGMNGQGSKGYGIVPVPLYRSGSTDKYLTQIHNNGKIGAISYSTDNFAQCTAFLNYQSLNSNHILNEYYNVKLQYDVVGGATGTVEMLQYIRANVRSSFDKAFEDAIGYYYGDITEGQSMEQKWHTMIQKADFKFDSMTASYASVTPVKAYNLYNLENNIFPTLPD